MTTTESELILPNVVGVGAARSATSYLYLALHAHPDIWVSPLKETNYLGIRSEAPGRAEEELAEYLAYFEPGRDHRWRFEASPVYLNHDPSLIRLVQLLPDARVVVQLRDPVERLWSNFKHHQKQHGMEDFSAYVAVGLDWLSDATRASADWFTPPKALSASLYARPLAFLRSELGTDQLVVLDYRELEADHTRYVRRVTDFLGLDPIPADAQRRNASNDDPVPPLDPDTKERLEALFEVDQQELEELIGWRY